MITGLTFLIDIKEHLSVILEVLWTRKHPNAKSYLISFCHLCRQTSSSCQAFTMVGPVPRLVRKIRLKRRRNLSRKKRKKRLDISERERVLAWKYNHTLSSGSLEVAAMDIENIAMLLVTQELNVPPVSTTSVIFMSHIDNGSISITDWITYKCIYGVDYHQDLHLIMTHFSLVLLDPPLILHHFFVLFLVLCFSWLYILFKKGQRRRMMQLLF